MLSRLLKHLAEDILPETQCSFRKDRSTTDMIFVARQLQEKSREQNRDIFMAFIDLSKAFDTVSRELLWKLLEKLGIPPTFLTILQQFHEGMKAQVQAEGLQSDPFDVKVGVKQGCVLAPILFIIFLLAVYQLTHAALGEQAGIGIQFRLDGNLFNIRRLQANTKTTLSHILELQYADDCAIVAHSQHDLQRALDVFHSVYSSLGLQVNTQKTEIIAQLVHQPLQPIHFHINQEPIKIVEQFPYLGSILSQTCTIDLEVQSRINRASAAFGRLRARVFCNKNLKVGTKSSVYHAVCVTTLLYGAETWTPYRRHIKLLEAFHMKCLKRILGITWQDKVTHDEIFQRTQTTTIETIMMKQHLRWLGHVIRMPEHRLPRQILYGQLSQGTRSPGGQKKRYKDHSKDLLKKSNIQPAALEQLAAERPTWRSTCHSAAAEAEQAASRRRDAKRVQRHQRAAGQPPPREQHPCHLCDKICGPRIGLHSHLQWHRRRR